MIAFISQWWKIAIGVLLPIGGIAAFVLLPQFALAVGTFLSTKGGRIAAACAAAGWCFWMYVASVEISAFNRGVQTTIEKIEKQDQRAIEAARKARIPVAECYARNGEWSVEEGLCHLPEE